MSKLVAILDATVDSLSKSDPNYTDAERALIAIKYNLLGLVSNLCQIGETGTGLDNNGLSYFASGLMDTIGWLDEKVLIPENWSIPEA